MPKKAVFTLKLEADLRKAFLNAAETTHRPASQLVREFMREFVEHHRQARKHDAWFRAKVQEALDDPRTRLAHDVVMNETRAIIDKIAADKG